MRRGAGFTLLELLTVVAIIAVLVTIGVGVLPRLAKRNELEASASTVRSLIRRARNAAREERAPSRVELDSRLGEVRASARSTLALFRFESDQRDGDAPFGVPDEKEMKKHPPRPKWDVRGSLGLVAHVNGAYADEGAIGDGLTFEAFDGGYAWVEDRPALWARDGVFLEASVFVPEAGLESKLRKRKDDDSTDRPRDLEQSLALVKEPPRPTVPRVRKYKPDEPPLFTIARKGRAFELALTVGYAVEVALSGPSQGAGEVTWIGRSADLSIEPRRWHRVGMSFDGRVPFAIIDGIPRQLEPMPGHETMPITLARERAPLVFSDPDPERGFFGRIDEVRYAGFVRADAWTVPKEIALLSPASELSFDALGALDPIVHQEPIVLWLSDDPSAVAALDPPAEAAKTRERRPGDAAKKLVDPEKAARFAALASKLPPEHVRRIVVDLAGTVR